MRDYPTRLAAPRCAPEQATIGLVFSEPCPFAQRACQQGIALLAKLCHATQAAAMGPEFELEGKLCVAGCVRPCTLAWQVSGAGGWVIGAGMAEDQASLLRAARQRKAAAEAGLPLPAAPRAMVSFGKRVQQ